jgi:hypothetical protein
MNVWNIGNTTVRNPLRLREALRLFVAEMSGRPFRRSEQLEFQQAMIKAGLVDSERVTGDDGGRKFASAFKQLGFVTDWSQGQSWEVTPVGKLLLEHLELQETIFLRQLLKYQIQSPLESDSRTNGFHLRPFRLLLRFLLRMHQEKLIGLTHTEIGMYVIRLLDEDDDKAFEDAIVRIKVYREAYDRINGKVAKTVFARERLKEVASQVGLDYGTLKDYADSNGRYALMSGLLALRGNKLAIAETKVPFVDALLADGSTLMPDATYLEKFYDPNYPPLPADDIIFVRYEIKTLQERIKGVAQSINVAPNIPIPDDDTTLLKLQAYEIKLRNRLREVQEIQFYHMQRTPEAIDEIEDLLESIESGGFASYAPAYLEWAIWRLFLAMNDLVGEISNTRGFQIDENMNPVHHAKGGVADLTLTYRDFKLVCEMTLANGSRQFAMEGEPVTRHVFKAIEASGDKPVYGVFVAKRLNPNTIDAFHNARYWKNYEKYIITPIVALEIKQLLKLVACLKYHSVSIADVRKLLDTILDMQKEFDNGPDWYNAYSRFYERWLKWRK